MAPFGFIGYIAGVVATALAGTACTLRFEGCWNECGRGESGLGTLGSLRGAGDGVGSEELATSDGTQQKSR